MREFIEVLSLWGVTKPLDRKVCVNEKTCSPIGNEILTDLLFIETIRTSDAQLFALAACGAKVSYKLYLGRDR